MPPSREEEPAARWPVECQAIIRHSVYQGNSYMVEVEFSSLLLRTTVQAPRNIGNM